METERRGSQSSGDHGCFYAWNETKWPTCEQRTSTNRRPIGAIGLSVANLPLSSFAHYRFWASFFAVRAGVFLSLPFANDATMMKNLCRRMCSYFALAFTFCSRFVFSWMRPWHTHYRSIEPQKANNNQNNHQNRPQQISTSVLCVREPELCFSSILFCRVCTCGVCTGKRFMSSDNDPPFFITYYGDLGLSKIATDGAGGVPRNS